MHAASPPVVLALLAAVFVAACGSGAILGPRDGATGSDASFDASFDAPLPDATLDAGDAIADARDVMVDARDAIADARDAIADARDAIADARDAGDAIADIAPDLIASDAPATDAADVVPSDVPVNDVIDGGANDAGPCPVGCDDFSPCTTDACDPVLGCTHAFNSNPCDDGRSCTVNDVCSGGVCAGTPGVEVCNGLDDDCNGVTDDGAAAGGGACATGQPGVCASGTMACVGGTLVCQPSTPPGPEDCFDTLDNDCDGAVNNGCPDVSLTLNGDCLCVQCPPYAPYPVGCNLSGVSGDLSRVCVGNTPNTPAVAFKEGGDCNGDHFGGSQLFCSPNQGTGLDGSNCFRGTNFPGFSSGCSFSCF